MEIRQVLRPASFLMKKSIMSSSPLVACTSTRQQSTTSRTKKALKIPPHSSFLTPKAWEDHIIFNPPSSAASVYHTPFKFLPKSDPRRQGNLSHLLSEPLPPSVEEETRPLAPLATKLDGVEKKYNVTKEQVEEMRQLRASDPATWSVVRLAEKYQCTKYFVMMCCRAPENHRKSERMRLEAIKARWGPIRKQAREERTKRKVLLHRGEL